MVKRNPPQRRGTRSAASTTGEAAAPIAPVEPVSPFERIDLRMEPILTQPSRLYAPDQTQAQACIQTTKILYDLGKTSAPKFLTIPDSVPTLITQTRTDFNSSSSTTSANTIPLTSDQIYAQLAIHTTPLLKRIDQQIRVLKQHVAREQEAMAKAEEEEELADEEDEAEQEAREMQEDEEMDGEDDDLDQDEEDENGAADEEMKDGSDEDSDADEVDDDVDEFGAYRGRGGVTEDAFFSLDDMEKFADMYENEEDEGEIENDMEDDADRSDEDEMDGNEDDDEEEEDEELDLDALRRRAIRVKHEASLKPLPKSLREEEVDLDEDVGDTNESVNIKYRDFFDPPPPELLKKKGKKGNKSLEDMYADEDKEDYVDDDDMDEFGGAFKELSTSAREGTLNKARVGGRKVEKEVEEAASESKSAEVPDSELSSYEKSQRKLRDQIAAIEKKIVQPREWAQLGEVTGKARPMDSLLETNLEFEHAGRVAPIITQEYTEELEAMIRRRILKEDFNDVVRKLESDLLPRQRKQREELNDAKSAVGLAEVYEQEYLAEQKVAEGLPTASEEKTNAAHQEIAGLIGALFHKLDSLCNFHYTPRSIQPDELEVTAKPAVSAIAMEEVLPVYMSSATHIAPQELYDVSEKLMVGATEKTAVERKSKHRRIKAQRKKAFDAAQSKEKASLQSMGKKATEGNAEQGVLRTAISSKEMKAATTARNVIQAGGKSVTGPSKSSSSKKNLAIGHGQNTKFSNSSAFFGKMQKNTEGPSNKKQKLR